MTHVNIIFFAKYRNKLIHVLLGHNANSFKKKGNGLDRKRLHDLVYIKYNQQLAQRYNIKDEIDPIVLNDIDECND